MVAFLPPREVAVMGTSYDGVYGFGVELDKSKPIVCLDFDGVIHRYDSGWKGADIIPDGPVDGAVSYLALLCQEFTVCIHSARSSSRSGREAMRRTIRDWGERLRLDPDQLAQLDEVQYPEHKPPAFLTIDDRAVRFAGAFPPLELLRDFTSWVDLRKSHQKTLVMMVGLPRSGKTTVAAGLSRIIAAPIVNPDSIRLALHGQAFVASAEPFVWATAHTAVNALFLAGHNAVILDACNVSRKRRDEWTRGQWTRRVFVPVKTSPELCRQRCDTEQMRSIVDRMAERSDPIDDAETSPQPTEGD